MKMGLLDVVSNAYYGTKTETGRMGDRHFTRNRVQVPVHFPDRESFAKFLAELEDRTQAKVTPYPESPWSPDATPEQILATLPRRPLSLNFRAGDENQDQIIFDNRSRASTTITVARRHPDASLESAMDDIIKTVLAKHAVPVPAWKRRLRVPVVQDESRDRVVDRQRASHIRWQSFGLGIIGGIAVGMLKGWLQL